VNRHLFFLAWKPETKVGTVGSCISLSAWHVHRADLGEILYQSKITARRVTSRETPQDWRLLAYSAFHRARRIRKMCPDKRYFWDRCHIISLSRNTLYRACAADVCVSWVCVHFIWLRMFCARSLPPYTTVSSHVSGACRQNVVCACYTYVNI